MSNVNNDAGAATSLPGIRDVFATVLETVTGGMAAAVKSTGTSGAPLLEAVTEVVKNAVRGAIGIGSDLIPASKAIVMGVVRGRGPKDEPALKILLHTAKTIVQHTADRGGDLAAATKGIVLGAIASAKSMGVDPARAASIAAQGAEAGASESGSVTAERVRIALKEPIGGMQVTLLPRLAL